MLASEFNFSLEPLGVLPIPPLALVVLLRGSLCLNNHMATLS